MGRIFNFVQNTSKILEKSDLLNSATLKPKNWNQRRIKVFPLSLLSLFSPPSPSSPHVSAKPAMTFSPTSYHLSPQTITTTASTPLNTRPAWHYLIFSVKNEQIAITGKNNSSKEPPLISPQPPVADPLKPQTQKLHLTSPTAPGLNHHRPPKL